jgi:hypothetical protein
MTAHACSKERETGQPAGRAADQVSLFAINLKTEKALGFTALSGVKQTLARRREMSALTQPQLSKVPGQLIPPVWRSGNSSDEDRLL